MAREEKRRKFTEAIINMLYPPPQPQTKNEDLGVNDYDEEPIPDDFGGTSSSTSNNDDEDCESESGKLTRAQRKRLRRKKIKIESSRRRQIVGPLLPQSEPVDTAAVLDGSPTVRQNAAEREEAVPSSADKSKVKQRRKAKKRTRETKSLLYSENGDFDRDRTLDLKSSNRESCD